MSAKQIKFGDDARQRMARGATILTRAVKATLVPRGRNVVIQKTFGYPAVTKDGVTEAMIAEIPELKHESL